MKVLIATDLLISMLLREDYVDGMDILFVWLKKLKLKWYMDISSLMILTHFSAMQDLSKFDDFRVLRGVPPLTDNILFLKRYFYDVSNETIDEGAKTLLPTLAWLDNGDVDFVITENSTLLKMACHINVDSRVYSIENFIEKCSIEHRSLDPTKGVIVKEVQMKSLDLSDKFFQSFITDYAPSYYSWFKAKENDKVFVSKDTKGKIKAILKLKLELENENYSNIYPNFKPARRLKISSFKVDYTGQKIGERFIRIVITYALKYKVNEIYVTIFNNGNQKRRLIDLLSDYGFFYYGTKDRKEEVYVKKMCPSKELSRRKNFPFVKYDRSAFIVPIHCDYSKDLLPNENIDFDQDDVEPYKSSVKKVITLYGDDNRMCEGTILLFYKMTRENKQRGIFAIGVVENIYRNIETQQQYVLRCRKRSILDDERLKNCWKYRDKNNKIVVVDFLYNYSFNDNTISAEKVNRSKIKMPNIHHQVPIFITKKQYKQIIEGTDYEKNINFD